MAVTEAQRQQQIREAEELLLAGPQQMGFAKALFFGRFSSDWVMPYPVIDESERPEADALRQRVRDFARNHIDAAAIDRDQDIPRQVIDGLAEAGLFRTTAPKEFGGLGLSQKAYCRALEEVARVCGSTALFVNVQHSIGLRALLLYGTEQQKRKWLTPILTAEKLAAFALTEPEAGSDAANVQTSATPTADGLHFTINGQKRYITSGGIADVLTLMARTPHPDKPQGAVTAFLITPDMPGFEVVTERMDKLGVRGTATGKLAFHEMKVPVENIFGEPGRGLHVALTILNYGRTTFGAMCTGAAKEAMDLAVAYANERVQFQQPIAEFELVQKKIGQMAEWVYAMEAMTRVTADLIDRGIKDFMLETAMLKVYCTEALWTIINDAFQVHGGAAYFTDRPLERMLRDARINQIGEGANEVLCSFIALLGMRGPGEPLKELADQMKKRFFSTIGPAVRLAGHRVAARWRIPDVPVRSFALAGHASQLGRLVRSFDRAVFGAMVQNGEAILDRQLVQERIANAAMEIFASACVLSRWDSELQASGGRDPHAMDGHLAADSFLRRAAQRTRRHLQDLKDNDDGLLLQAARQALKQPEADRPGS